MKDHLVVLGSMESFSLYWVQDDVKYRKNKPLHDVTGRSFCGKVLLFRQRHNSLQLGDLYDGDLELVADSLRWYDPSIYGFRFFSDTVNLLQVA